MYHTCSYLLLICLSLHSYSCCLYLFLLSFLSSTPVYHSINCISSRHLSVGLLHTCLYIPSPACLSLTSHSLSLHHLLIACPHLLVFPHFAVISPRPFASPHLTISSHLCAFPHPLVAHLPACLSLFSPLPTCHFPPQQITRLCTRGEPLHT